MNTFGLFNSPAFPNITLVILNGEARLYGTQSQQHLTKSVLTQLLSQTAGFPEETIGPTIKSLTECPMIMRSSQTTNHTKRRPCPSKRLLKPPA